MFSRRASGRQTADSMQGQKVQRTNGRKTNNTDLFIRHDNHNEPSLRDMNQPERSRKQYSQSLCASASLNAKRLALTTNYFAVSITNNHMNHSPHNIIYNFHGKTWEAFRTGCNKIDFMLHTVLKKIRKYTNYSGKDNGDRKPLRKTGQDLQSRKSRKNLGNILSVVLILLTSKQYNYVTIAYN
jgi:hypothetical protein